MKKDLKKINKLTTIAIEKTLADKLRKRFGYKTSFNKIVKFMYENQNDIKRIDM